jgi:hypothetical protein
MALSTILNETSTADTVDTDTTNMAARFGSHCGLTRLLARDPLPACGHNRASCLETCYLASEAYEPYTRPSPRQAHDAIRRGMGTYHWFSSVHIRARMARGEWPIFIRPHTCHCKCHGEEGFIYQTVGLVRRWIDSNTGRMKEAQPIWGEMAS